MTICICFVCETPEEIPFLLERMQNIKSPRQHQRNVQNFIIEHHHFFTTHKKQSLQFTCLHVLIIVKMTMILLLTWHDDELYIGRTELHWQQIIHISRSSPAAAPRITQDHGFTITIIMGKHYHLPHHRIPFCLFSNPFCTSYHDHHHHHFVVCMFWCERKEECKAKVSTCLVVQ